MTEVVTLPVSKVFIRADARVIDQQAVAGLVDSVATLGLINPIRVRQHCEGFEVIAGAHRLEAHRSMGLIEIECVVVDDDDLHAELAMIDENLCRAELSPSDRARQTARRKAIYLELHPETGHGKAGPNKDDKLSSFAQETARATGRDERTVQRDASRGEKVIEEVLDLIRGTKLDTGTYLDKLKKMPPNDQVKAVKRDLALDKKAAKAARAAEQAEFDRQRDEARENLSPEVKAAQTRKDEAIAARKGRTDDAVAALEAERDELREANAALESELAEAKAENAKWQDMRVQFEQGGFEKVVADLREEIRVLQTRVETESTEKVRNLRSADYWQKEARKIGYGDDDIIPLTPTGGGHG